MAASKATIDPRLDSCFAKLSAPAQGALIEHHILSVADLAKWPRAEVKRMHGIGPSAFPVLEQALADAGLDFKP
jgi:hypothetical protein